MSMEDANQDLFPDLQNASARLTRPTRAYFDSRTRSNLYDLVIMKIMEKYGEGGNKLPVAIIAKRLGYHVDKAERVLCSPGSWTLQTLSDLLLAIGMELVPSSRDLAPLLQTRHLSP